jgi:hypothetical protein
MCKICGFHGGDYEECKRLASWMLRHVSSVRTNVTGEHIVSIISMTRIGELFPLSLYASVASYC